MGNHLLTGPPRTPGFKRVIALLGDGAGGAGAVGVSAGTLEEIAEATIAASDEGLQRAKADEGLAFCLYMMATLARTAGEPGFAASLSNLGFPAPVAAAPTQPVTTAPTPEYSIFDLVSGFSSAVDQHLRRTRTRTDIGELSQLAACESLSSLCPGRTETLFGTIPSTAQESLRKYATEKGFARLAHDFFARFSRRYIEYHLSRELSNHVGPKRRFAGARDHNDFLRQLGEHCRVTTGVIRQFAGKWYSKHKFHQDITLKRTRGFAAHAVDKLRAALRYRELRDAE